MNDWRLLRQFIEKKSNSAFDMLLERHLSMVYWTCRRELGDTHRAEDATQEVFLMLIRKATTLNSSVQISGWLFNTSLLVCKNITRGEQRRERLQEEANKKMTAAANPEPDWLRIEPTLNDAIASLSGIEREIVLRRYLDGFSLREVAQQTGISEDAASKRSVRAIEKLRKFFKASGVAVAAGSLTRLLGENSRREIPSVLHESIAGVAALEASRQSATLIGHSLPTLIKKGVYLTMALSKKSIVAIVIGGFLLAGGTGVSVVLSKAKPELVPPPGLAEGFRWQESRMNGNYLTQISTGPFWSAGADKSTGVLWMIRGVCKVNVKDSTGRTWGSASNSSNLSCPEWRLVYELVFGENIDVTEKSVKDPQIAMDVNGTTTYASGYGTHVIKDQTGKVVQTLDIEPLT